MIRGYADVLRLYWPMLMFGLLTVSFSNFGQSFFIGWFGAPIQAELGLSASAYGSIYSVAKQLADCRLGGIFPVLTNRSLVTAFGVLSTTASPILLGLMIDSGISARGLLWSMAAYVLFSLIMAWQSFRV